MSKLRPIVIINMLVSRWYIPTEIANAGEERVSASITTSIPRKSVSYFFVCTNLELSLLFVFLRMLCIVSGLSKFETYHKGFVRI
jgi:hypothetical protein